MYVPSILDGTKADTIRLDCRWQPGDLLRASVGPRPPFALLEVIGVEQLHLSDLPAERRDALQRLYGARCLTVPLYRVRFRVRERLLPGVSSMGDVRHLSRSRGA